MGCAQAQHGAPHDTKMTMSRPERQVAVATLLTKQPSEPLFDGLALAAQVGDAQKAKEYIEQGQNVNACSKGNLLPLHGAAEHGHLPVLCLLLQSGAQVNSQTGAYMQTPLHRAVNHGHVQLVDALLEAKADVNQKNGQGWTPLHVAAARSSLIGFDLVPIAQKLLDAGADTHAKSPDGYTALAMADDWGTRGMTDLLRSMGGTR